MKFSRDGSIVTVVFDENDLIDSGKAFSAVKQCFVLRKREDRGFKSANDVATEKFHSALAIYETDISSVYSGVDFDSERKYYVYAHLDPSRKILLSHGGALAFGATLGLQHPPFYIGKGSGDRAFDLNRNGAHRKMRQRIKKFHDDAIVFIIKENLTEVEALCLESKLIDIFGLQSEYKLLTNLDEGINATERRMLYSEHMSVLNRIYKNSA